MAAKLEFNDKNEIVLEHYGQQPVKLMGVRLWK